MNENYYLKIGGTEAFSEQSIADLSSADADKKKKANAVLLSRERSRPFPTCVRIGTLLKTDDKGQRIEFLQQAVAEIGDATVNPPIVGNGRDRSLRGNHAHNRPVQDRDNAS
jgi:hypothetical protein